MTLTYSRYFRFGVPDFLSSPWQADWNTLVQEMDRVLYTVLLARTISVWANSTVYAVGALVFDPVSGFVYEALVAHTSAASPTLFSADRVAHPSYWQAFTFAALAPDIDIITGNTVNITDERYIIFNKAVAAASTVNLPTVSSRGGLSLVIVDWANNAGDITINAFGGETVMGSAAWIVGSGGKITLDPNTDLSGWVVVTD